MIWGKSKSKSSDVDSKYRDVVLYAKSLAKTQEFQTFAKRYAEYRENIIQQMISFDEADPMKYAFQMNSFVERIRALGILVNEVIEDSKKELPDEKSEEKA